MEIYKTSFRGTEVNVIFTGSHYHFHNSYYGVIAVAERDYDKTDASRLLTEGKAATFFTITTGNRHTLGGSLGGSVVSSLVKRFIRKAEQRCAETEVEFADVTDDLADGHLSCNYRPAGC